MSNHRHLVRSMVYVTAGRPSVCLSVCPITRPLHSVATGLLLCARLQEISIDCCMAGGQQQRRRSTALSSECEQCHVINRRRKLNTDLVTKPLRISLPIFFHRNTTTRDGFNIRHLSSWPLHTERKCADTIGTVLVP